MGVGILAVVLFFFIVIKLESTPVTYLKFFTDIPSVPWSVEIIDYKNHSSFTGSGSTYIEANVNTDQMQKIIADIHKSQFQSFDNTNNEYRGCKFNKIENIIKKSIGYYKVHYYDDYSCEISVVDKGESKIYFFKKYD